MKKLVKIAENKFQILLQDKKSNLYKFNKCTYGQVAWPVSACSYEEFRANYIEKNKTGIWCNIGGFGVVSQPSKSTVKYLG